MSLLLALLDQTDLIEAKTNMALEYSILQQYKCYKISISTVRDMV